MEEIWFLLLKERMRKNVCCLNLRKARGKVSCLEFYGGGVYEQGGSSGRLSFL